MTILGYLEANRVRKSQRIIGSFIRGAGGRMLVTDALDADAKQHVFYGQLWTAARLIPEAIKAGADYWHIDNGWMLSARGEAHGYYRVTRRSPSPIFIPGTDPERAMNMGLRLQPWRRDGGHVLLAYPGMNFGRPWGLDMGEWRKGILDRLRAVTDRRIVERDKMAERPLEQDLEGAWCVVTHSSNVAVDAALAGVPVICEPTSPTAPLGNVGLEHVERPHLSDRRGEWLSSLAWQQFTLKEMQTGLAWRALSEAPFPAHRAARSKAPRSNAGRAPTAPADAGGHALIVPRFA